MKTNNGCRIPRFLRSIFIIALVMSGCRHGSRNDSDARSISPSPDSLNLQYARNLNAALFMVADNLEDDADFDGERAGDVRAKLLRAMDALAETHCGWSEHRPNQRGAPDALWWGRFMCVHKEQSWDGRRCYTWAEYTHDSMYGCPGEQLCCPGAAPDL